MARSGGSGQVLVPARGGARCLATVRSRERPWRESSETPGSAASFR